MTRTSPPAVGAYRRLTESDQELGLLAGSRERIYLHAGQYMATESPSSVSTILGSCVAVCLWDPQSKTGGINHFVLPHFAGSGRLSPRFGNVAIASLIESLCGLGSRTDGLMAKIFGGAGVLGTTNGEDLGARNVAVARTLLEQEGIPIVGEDVGGSHGRKLIFHTDAGTAWIKRL